MAGVANPNYACFFIDTTKKRSGEVTGADWDGGCNNAGSNAPGVGINTGDYDPKTTDWPRAAAFGESQHIGVDSGANNRIQTVPDGNDQVRFIQATANVADDGEFPTSTGAFNRTGKTVPSGSWAWAHVPVT